MPARLANAGEHSIAALPAAGTLTNAGEKTAGGMENIGTATSSTFTMVETIQCIDTYSVPLIDPTKAPLVPPNIPPYEAAEVGSVPIISCLLYTSPSPRD